MYRVGFGLDRGVQRGLAAVLVIIGVLMVYAAASWRSFARTVRGCAAGCP
jgi:uncharacterized membrane protein